MLRAAVEVVLGREALVDLPVPGSRHQCDRAHTEHFAKRIWNISWTRAFSTLKTHVMLNNYLLLGAGGARCYEAR